MKNIHILPTDKPSRIISSGKEFTLLKNTTIDKRCKNIYITSDDEIKKGDWFYLDMSHSNTLPDEIHQMGKDKWSKTGGIHFCEGNTWVDSCKKIILTTDQDLIKDGVQQIDDEFLEWFVKNSSCESVEIRYTVDFNSKAVIIIPKEEPKQTVQEYEQQGLEKYSHELKSKQDYKKMSKKFTETLTSIPDDVLIKYTQQETLEEAAKDYIENTMRFSFNSMETKTQANRMLKCVEFGAKWQKERSYSEKEVFELLNAFNKHTLKLQELKLGNSFSVTDWFEQFKKK